MKYRITFELPDNETVLSGIKTAQVEWSVWGYSGRTHVEPEQRWIPVSKETNPKKSGWYLVTCSEEITAENKRFSGMAEYNATTGEWFDVDEPTDLYLAWQNMPEPYGDAGQGG